MILHLTINPSKLDIIKNQLGETVSVVTEPERRDTFPAIALSANYLKLVKGCNDDEVVVIMPCDPYIGSIIRGHRKNGRMRRADIVLMGIPPPIHLQNTDV